MNEVPLISVIIRSMGRPSLGQALESVSRQTYTKMEVVVVDATAGNHPPLPARYGAVPLRIVGNGNGNGNRNRLNRPQAANCGIDHARGEWLIFLDDDDFFHPDHIRVLLDAATSEGTLAAYSGTRLLDLDDREIGTLNERYARLKLCAGNFIQMGAAIFSRELLAMGCRFDESMLLYQDWDFWLQISRQSHFAHSTQVTNNWRVNSGHSGAGRGANANERLQLEFESRVKTKWAPFHRRLIAFVHDHSHRAAALLETRPALAARILRRALKLMPNDPTLINMLGIARFRSGDLTGAWQALDEVKALLPGNDAVDRNLAKVLHAQKNRSAGADATN